MHDNHIGVISEGWGNLASQTTFVKVVCLCEEWAVHVVYTYVVTTSIHLHMNICLRSFLNPTTHSPFITSNHLKCCE